MNIVHNYYGSNKGREKASIPHSDVKSELKTLLANEKADKVIERLLEITEEYNKDLNNSVLLQSARLNRVNKQEQKGILASSSADIERNKINNSLLSLINELEDS